METIREHFESSSLAEAIPPRSKHSVLTLEHNMTVAEALKVKQPPWVTRPWVESDMGGIPQIWPTVACSMKQTQALAHRKILSAPVVISDSLEDMENEGFDRMSAPVNMPRQHDSPPLARSGN